jgi:hypothetical protein
MLVSPEPRILSVPDAASANPAEAVTVTALSVAIFSSIFLQRFAFEVAGYPIQFILVVVLAVLAYLMWRHSARLDPMRLTGFLFVTFVLALEGLLTRGTGSMPSLGLLLVLYIMNTLTVTMSRETYDKVLLNYQRMMVIVAVLGVAQFFGQFLLPGKYLFTFQYFVPSDLLLPNFNTVIPVIHGGSFYKSNGFVFIEPATFSQYLAVAIIIELAVFRSLRRFAVFAVTYVFTYSGTGLIILGATLPLFLGSLRLRHVLAGGVVFVVALIVLGGALNLEVFMDRAGTFSNEHSSAFARFIGPWVWIRDIQIHDPWAIFFGFGPGSVERFTHPSVYTEFHDPTWAKVIIEYGIIGALAFFSFYLYTVFSLAHERRLNWALLVMFMVTGGALLNPFMACLILLLGILPARTRQADEPASEVTVLVVPPAILQAAPGIAPRSG